MRTIEEVKCYHCGQPCSEAPFKTGDLSFCCYGCKVIYEIINANDLCEYYNIQNFPGTTSIAAPEQKIFAYLDDEKVRSRVVDFDSPDFARVNLFVPAIHCSSCIWLLEHLEKMNSGVIKSEVNFGKKTVSISFNPARIKLSTVAGILNSIGYSPVINLDKGELPKNLPDTTHLIRLGIAGFCFGNVMLF